MIKMPDSSQEPPASSKAPNEDLKDMDVLCTFKIKIESQNLGHGCIKDQWPYPNQNQGSELQPGIFSFLKSHKKGLKGHGCSLYLYIKRESPYLELRCIKDQWQYPNQIQDTKPQSWTSIILQSYKSELKGHGCSLNLQNQDGEQKFGSWVYQRPVTISKSRSGCRTPVRNLQHPPKPQMRTWRTWMFFAPSNLGREPKFGSWFVSKTSDLIQIKIKIQNSSQDLQHPPKRQMRT